MYYISLYDKMGIYETVNAWKYGWHIFVDSFYIYLKKTKMISFRKNKIC